MLNLKRVAAASALIAIVAMPPFAFAEAAGAPAQAPKAPPQVQAAPPAAADPEAAPPAATPYFLNVLKEGERTPPRPRVQPPMTQEQATSARLLAAAASMKHLGLFAAGLLALVIAAGVLGGAAALLIWAIRSWRQRSADKSGPVLSNVS